MKKLQPRAKTKKELQEENLRLQNEINLLTERLSAQYQPDKAHADDLQSKINFLEAELSKSEKMFQTAFNNVNIGFCLVSKDGRIFRVNKLMCEMLGYTAEELTGKSYTDITYEPDLQISSTMVGKLVSGSIPGFTLEKRYIHKEGHIVQANLNASVIRNNTGEPEFFVATVLDTTKGLKAEKERREAEQKLTEKIEELDRYFQMSLDLLCIADTSGRFIRLNPEWEKVLGYSLAELEGSIFLDYVHPDDIQNTLDSIAKLKAQVQVLSFENRYRCKDGSYRWIEWRSQPMGELIYAAARDITTRKNNEVTLKQYAEELKESNATKDKFISIISHDLRGPFQGFLGISDMLANEIESLSKDDIIEMSSHLNKALNAQFNLLNDLLSWSKINSGKMKFAPVMMKPSELIDYTYTMLDSAAQVKNIQLIKEIDEDCCYYADYEMIQLVLRNLVSNAIKFSNANGRVMIKIENRDGFVKTSVIDDGVGIPEKELENLFRLDKHYTTAGTSNEKGSGLGLLMCKEIIEKHGGSISVESIENKGSCFSFILPVKDQH